MTICRVLFVLVLTSVSTYANAGCGQAQPIMEYRSTPPLLAYDPHSSLIVRVHEDGCVATRMPRQDIRHGTYVLKLDERDLDRLRAELDAAGILAIDPIALRADVAEQKRMRSTTSSTLYRVSDENIIEFRFAGSTPRETRRLRFSSLRDDLLNVPYHPEVLGIAAAQQLFEALANRAHETSGKHEKGSQ